LETATPGKTVFWQITWEGTKDLFGRPNGSAPKPLHIEDEEEATIVYRLMKQYAGHPAHNIPLQTPGEHRIFQAFGHYGIVQSPSSFLKVTVIGERIPIPD
jgi:hypothetical protein